MTQLYMCRRVALGSPHSTELSPASAWSGWWCQAGLGMPGHTWTRLDTPEHAWIHMDT